MSAPDISAEAVEHTAVQADEVWADLLYLMGRASLEGHEVGQSLGVATRQKLAQTAAMLRALRAALDAAERERDEADARGDDWHDQASKFRHERDAADATGYARGVRDAAGLFENAQSKSWMGVSIVIAILALLPATDATKETRDDQ